MSIIRLYILLPVKVSINRAAGSRDSVGIPGKHCNATLGLPIDDVSFTWTYVSGLLSCMHIVSCDDGLIDPSIGSWKARSTGIRHRVVWFRGVWTALLHSFF
jgi:hypothetical protein